MKIEKPYDFRERLLTVHEKDIRNLNRKAEADEYELPSQVSIKISASAGEVIQVAAEDFADYLKSAMGLAAKVVTEGTAEVTISLAEDAGVDMGEFAAYRGFKIETKDTGIFVYGHDERGAAQGLFYIEDLMTFTKAPVLTKGVINKIPAYTMQMVHSGYREDVYPDEYLMRVAHEGRDSITLCVHGKGGEEYDNANDLIRRAARYGIDVYAYSEVLSRMNPESPEAEAYYDGIYGELFKACPGFRGIVFVGESIEFPSKDPNIGGGYRGDLGKDGIPGGKPSSGWWPCEDYPVVLNCK